MAIALRTCGLPWDLPFKVKATVSSSQFIPQMPTGELVSNKDQQGTRKSPGLKSQMLTEKTSTSKSDRPGLWLHCDWCNLTVLWRARLPTFFAWQTLLQPEPSSRSCPKNVFYNWSQAKFTVFSLALPWYSSILSLRLSDTAGIKHYITEHSPVIFWLMYLSL